MDKKVRLGEWHDMDKSKMKALREGGVNGVSDEETKLFGTLFIKLRREFQGSAR